MSFASVAAQVHDCFRRGDADGALRLLENASRTSADPEVWMNLALARRMKGDLAGAVAALDAALARDPYNFVALLSKGSVLDAAGRRKAAVEVWRNALKIAPADDRLPPPLQAPVAQARRAVRDHAEAVARHMREAVAPLRERHAGQPLDRFDECLDIFAGLKKAYVAEPLYLTFPRLPAIPYFDREPFPWLERLEAATDTVRAEVERVLAEDRADFAPYIQFPAGAPVNQWEGLNHNPNWSTLHLWRDGAKDEAVCARLPQTTALLESLPMADQPGFAPTAMISVLAPKTRIPPHTGSSNVRLICHLPLILPGQCFFRVGNETREWTLGEAFVFDDTIEHEAWNDSDQTRVVLIFDVWNPLLSEAERELVSAMSLARREFESRE